LEFGVWSLEFGVWSSNPLIYVLKNVLKNVLKYVLKYVDFFYHLKLQVYVLTLSLLSVTFSDRLCVEPFVIRSGSNV